jgi:hypothetical protein
MLRGSTASTRRLLVFWMSGRCGIARQLRRRSPAMSPDAQHEIQLSHHATGVDEYDEDL